MIRKHTCNPGHRMCPGYDLKGKSCHMIHGQNPTIWLAYDLSWYDSHTLIFSANRSINLWVQTQSLKIVISMFFSLLILLQCIFWVHVLSILYSSRKCFSTDFQELEVFKLDCPKCVSQQPWVTVRWPSCRMHWLEKAYCQQQQAPQVSQPMGLWTG